MVVSLNCFSSMILFFGEAFPILNLGDIWFARVAIFVEDEFVGSIAGEDVSNETYRHHHDTPRHGPLGFNWFLNQTFQRLIRLWTTAPATLEARLLRHLSKVLLRSHSTSCNQGGFQFSFTYEMSKGHPTDQRLDERGTWRLEKMPINMQGERIWIRSALCPNWPVGFKSVYQAVSYSVQPDI